MAAISFSPEDIEMIESTLDQLDPATHELFEAARMDIDDTDWDFVIHHARTKIRSALEIGLTARAFADFSQERDVADERGVDHFLRSKAWVHNFGVTQTADELFHALSIRTGNRLVRALDCLVEIAQDRAFCTLDDEYRRLFPSQP